MGIYREKLMKIISRISSRQSLQATYQLRFLNYLYRLLEAGYSFVEALEMVKWDQKLRQPADKIMDVLQSGKHVDEAFKEAAFHPSITSFLYLARFDGDVPNQIKKCMQMFEQRTKQLQKFKQVIRYPIILCLLFVILLFFLKTSVLPSFTEIFQASPESASSILIAMNIIDLMTTFCIFFVLFSILLTIGWKFYKHHFDIDRQLAILQRIPILKHFLRLQTSYYLASHMSMFLKAGLSMKNILEHLNEQRKLPIVRYYASLMLMRLLTGQRLESLLYDLPFVDKQLAEVVYKSTNVQTMEKDLDMYAAFVTEEIEQKTMKLITYIQPAVFTLLAGMIVFIYLTLMWPMFQLIQTV